jgi:hypothetical protein
LPASRNSFDQLQALGNPFTPTQLRECCAHHGAHPAQCGSPLRLNYCLRVARRMSLTIRSDGSVCFSDFCLISTRRMVTMSQKSSSLQPANFVSKALIPDRCGHLIGRSPSAC